jgi:VCBS repeat-containing protein
MLSSTRELLGKNIGNYRLSRLIGVGGTGAVFLGRCDDGDEMAVKILIPPMLVSEESLNEFHKRFEREAEILSQLDHPHILPLKGFGTDEASGFPYMVMPYKSGGTLVEQIQAGQLPFDKIIKYVWQLAQALTYAHERNIIHRDLKPANVLLDEDDQVSLADFSIAKLFNLSTTTLTSTHQMLGTPAYMAPEQVSNQPISPATDVYGLGVLTYQLITGRLPFDVSTLLALLQRIVHENPPPPHGIRSDLPPAASDILFKAMAKEQEARFPSTEDFALALEECMQDVLLIPFTTQARQAIKEKRQSTPLPTTATPVSDNKADDEAHQINLTYANDAPTIAANYAPFALEEMQAAIISATHDALPSNTSKTSTPLLPLEPKALTHKHYRLVPITVNQNISQQEDLSSSLTQLNTIQPQDGPEPSSKEQHTPTTPPNETVSMATTPQKSVLVAEHKDVTVLATQLGRLKSSIYPSQPGIDISDAELISTTDVIPQKSILNQPTSIRATIVKPSTQLTGNSLLPRWRIVVASILIFLLISEGIFSLFGYSLGIFAHNNQAVPTPLPPATSATISIIPDSKMLQKTFTISAVIGLPDPNQHQVLARWLSGTTQPQQQTVNTTGKVANPAMSASGTLLFTNNSITGAVNIPAGTILASNGNTVKTQVVLDEAVNLPAALAVNPNQRPTQRVRVHYAIGGAVGNIAAQKFFFATKACLTTNPVCYAAINDAPFIGGTDEQNYMFVQQSDIDGAAKALLTLAPDPQQVLQDQISGNEQWIITPSCKSQINANHTVNDKAADVTVSITFTCAGEVYDKKGALAVAMQELKDIATNTIGNNYVLSGNINATQQNTQVTDAGGTVKVTIDTKGKWVYQLDAISKEDLAKTLAGKKKLEVQTILKTQKTFKSATIQLTGGDQDTCPTDPQQITINMQPS